MVKAICLDASILVKLATAEPGAEMASQLVKDALQNGIRMVAPFFYMAEVLSVLRRQVQRGLLVPGAADDALDALFSLQVEEVSGVEMYRRAWEIAGALEMPTVYDAVYLAVAELRNATFWTADETLYRRASDLGYVRLLGADPGS